MGRMMMAREALFGRNEPLEEVAHRISVHMSEARTCARDVMHHRLAAGFLLLEARERVPTGWQQWCKLHFGKSARDIRKCIALANSPNGQAAIGKEREDNRKAKQRQRQRERADVRPQPDNDLELVTKENPIRAMDPEVDEALVDHEIEPLLKRIRKLGDGQRARLFSKLRQEYDL
jgi:hypothetical protein